MPISEIPNIGAGAEKVLAGITLSLLADMSVDQAVIHITEWLPHLGIHFPYYIVGLGVNYILVQETQLAEDFYVERFYYLVIADASPNDPVNKLYTLIVTEVLED